MVARKNINSYALISVYDKTSLKKICVVLKKYNIGIISTGSTAKKIISLGFYCTEVSHRFFCIKLRHEFLDLEFLLSHQEFL